MKFLLALVSVAAAVAVCHGAAHGLDEAQWVLFKAAHGKSYLNEREEAVRRQTFQDNVRKINAHNELFEQGLVSFRARINEFADMEHREFASTMNGYNKSGAARPAVRAAARFVAPANQVLAANVDWRTQGYVTEVKNQGQCGSCWSFSATGSLEGQHFRKTGRLVSLSEQNLVDCSGSYGNQGCNGGWMDSAFEYIRDNRGIDTESSYPYEAYEGSCRFNRANVGATDTGFVDIAEGSEADLKAAAGTVGPIAVAMDAGHQSFQFYGDGIYYEPACSSTMLDHGVLVVGYGTDNGQDYWLVKNSWGTSWGLSGYFKIARNLNNHCGLATKASYPTV